MRSERRRFTDDFKAAGVERLCQRGATQGGVAKELGVTSSQLKTWRLEIEAFGSAEAKRRQQADAAELAQLRRDNKRLKDEVEILQKGEPLEAPLVQAQWRTLFSPRGWGRHDREARFHPCPEGVLSHHAALRRVGDRPGGPARSWFYGFTRSGPDRQRRSRARDERDAALLPRIKRAFTRSKRRYGSKRIHRDLIADGEAVSERRVAKIMRKTISHHACANPESRARQTAITA